MTKKPAERAGQGGFWDVASGALLPVNEYLMCMCNVDANKTF